MEQSILIRMEKVSKIYGILPDIQNSEPPRIAGGVLILRKAQLTVPTKTAFHSESYLE